MKRKATRQDEEAHTLIKYLKNNGIGYEPLKAFWPPQDDPRDVSYDGIDYQITYGSQKDLANRRKITSSGKIFLSISGQPTDYAKIYAGIPLGKKKNQADKKITLLIDCPTPGFYDPEMIERKKIFKLFVNSNEYLIKIWQNVFLVYNDGNITL